MAGLDVALEVFRAVDPGIGWDSRAREGDRFDAGNLIASRRRARPRAPHRRSGWP